MTTIRLTPRQKGKLSKASEILAGLRRRRLSQGDAVEVLADFALHHRGLLAESADDIERPRGDDPFFDRSLTFDFGPTDERTHDRLLYGRK